SARPLRAGMNPSGRPRTHYAFPFSDQYTLRRTLDVPEVTTRLSLDSGLLTGLLFALRGAGVFRAARLAGLEPALTAAFARARIGGDDFAVRADGYYQGRHAARVLTARSQTRITGLVAAEVAARVHAGDVPAGVHHIEQVPEVFAGLPAALTGDGLTSWRVADRS
ncbi:saccharopine dehydrogenase, partial [Streptomyces sp. NPDC049577]